MDPLWFAVIVVAIVCYIIITTGKLTLTPLRRDIYKCQLGNRGKVFKEVVKYYKECGMVKSNNSSVDWNANHLTTAHNKLKYQNLHTFERELMKSVHKLCDTLKIPRSRVSLRDPNNTEDASDYWVNFYTKGHNQGPHQHMNDDQTTPFYCFTYFARYDKKKDAALRFYTDVNDELPAIERESIVFDMKEGEIVFFRPSMEHSVDLQTTDGPRITVSGNLYMT